MNPPGSIIEVAGRQYECYCHVPAAELNALPEPDRTKAWNHVLQHKRGTEA